MALVTITNTHIIHDKAIFASLVSAGVGVTMPFFADTDAL